MTEFVKQVPKAKRSPFPILTLGAMIGRLHALAVPAGADRPAGAMHHFAEGTMADELRAVAAWLDSIEARVPGGVSHALDTLRTAVASADGGEGLPEAFVHPDPVPQNAIFTADGPVLVDWTSAGRGPRLPSMTLVLLSGWAAVPFMKGYARVVALTDEERDRLPELLFSRQLINHVFRVCRDPKIAVTAARKLPPLRRESEAKARDLLSVEGELGGDEGDVGDCPETGQDAAGALASRSWRPTWVRFVNLGTDGGKISPKAHPRFETHPAPHVLTGHSSRRAQLPLVTAPAGPSSHWSQLPPGPAPTGPSSHWSQLPPGPAPTGPSSHWSQLPPGPAPTGPGPPRTWPPLDPAPIGPAPTGPASHRAQLPPGHMLGAMTERSLEVLVGSGTFYEGPRWHEGRWWVSDFYRHTVFAITPDGEQLAVMSVDQQPSGLGWLPDGTMLVVSMKDRRLLRRTTAGAVEEVADLSGLASGYLNDMVVDQRGRAWIGNFGYDLMGGGEPAPANVIRVDPDGTAAVVAEEMSFPNGSVVTPDGRTLIVGESLASRYTAFTIADDGSLADRRVWADLSDPGVAPDGCGLDAEGHIWTADAFGNRCVRVAEGGAVVDEIRSPDGLGVFACMLGGADGRSLLMCCAPGFQEKERASANDAALITVEVDVPHAGCP